MTAQNLQTFMFPAFFPPANFCVGIFALVGLSVLEAMVITLLSDLDGYCDHNLQRCADSTVEIELDVGSHNGKKKNLSIFMVL